MVKPKPSLVPILKVTIPKLIPETNKPKEWTVKTKGHVGDIRVAAGMYQRIFARWSGAVVPFVVNPIFTIFAYGPSGLEIYVDPAAPDPSASGIPPTVVLLPGQSTTVTPEKDILVRGAGPGKGIGKYFVSWCCIQFPSGR